MCWSVLTPSNHLPSSSRTQESLCLHWQGDTKEKTWLECDWRRLPIFYLVFRKLCAERRAPFQTHRAVTCHQHSRKPHFCAPFSWASGTEAPQGGLMGVHHILRGCIVRGQPNSGNTKTHGWSTTSHTPWGHNPFVLFWMWVFQFSKGQIMLLLLAYYKISLPWKQGKPNSSLFWWV